MKFMDDFKENFHHGASKKTFEKTKELRKNSTKAEEILWEYLRNRKLNDAKFRRQHAVLNYILDFYCHEFKLGIELDGNFHNSSFDKEYDRLRTKNLNTIEIKIIRFYDQEILDNVENVLSIIKMHLTKSPTK